MKKEIGILILLYTVVLLTACAAMQNKTCVKYTDKIEHRQVCNRVGGYECVHNSHVHDVHKHGGVSHSTHCTHGNLSARKVCHYETANVQVCVRYVCNPGYVRNPKNHCVDPNKPVSKSKK